MPNVHEDASTQSAGPRSPTGRTSADAAVALAGAMVGLRARLRRESAGSAGRWSWPQLMALIRVVNQGSITTTELAEAERVRPQSMTDTVAALKSAGFVASSPDPNDRRRQLITPTALGRRMAADLTEARQNWLTKAIEATVEPREFDLLCDAADLLARLAETEVR